MVVEWNLGGGGVGLGAFFRHFWTIPCAMLAFAKKRTASKEILVFENLG